LDKVSTFLKITLIYANLKVYIPDLQEVLTMAFDFKKEYKELYMPKTEPEIIDVPQMNL